MQAQRYAVIDTKYILNKMPEYVQANKQIQLISEQWQKEIDDKQAALDQMYKNYAAEQVMLSDELKINAKQNCLIKKKRYVICRKKGSVMMEMCLKNAND